jgi:CheY-like chemotaxis protein
MSLVLVVDDDIDLLNLYTDLLEEMGLEVISALDGVDALRLAIERKPQLVLTDWRMPRMDGIELCKALKRSSLLGRTRLILHSSEAIPEPWCAEADQRGDLRGPGEGHAQGPPGKGGPPRTARLAS